jgi:hypothetical protein
MLSALSLHSKRIADLENLLRRYGGQPAYWATDVNAHIKELQRAMTDPLYVVPSDLASAFGDEAARALAPRLVRRYGELMVHWKTIRDAAERLGSGLAFARRI